MITRVCGVIRPKGLGDLRSPVVRHEALLLPNGGERPPSPCRRSGGVKLEAAWTKSRRSGTAGWAGRGERSGKVYARNRLRYASLGRASSKPVDTGWMA